MLRLSLEQLAEESGVSSATIHNFEVGRHEPREDTLVRIQAALEQHGIRFRNGEQPTVILDRKAARKTVRAE